MAIGFSGWILGSSVLYLGRRRGRSRDVAILDCTSERLVGGERRVWMFRLTTSIEIRKWRVWTTTLLATVLAFLFAGLEVLLTFMIRIPYRRGVSWPVTLVGVVAAVLLIVGYAPVPFELWKRRGRVVGIDFGFLTIDWFGAFFSLMAIGESMSSFALGGCDSSILQLRNIPLTFLVA